MSNQTPRQAFRIPLNVLRPAKTKAAAQGVTLTSIVVNALTEYGADESDEPNKSSATPMAAPSASVEKSTDQMPKGARAA